MKETALISGIKGAGRLLGRENLFTGKIVSLPGSLAYRYMSGLVCGINF
jgi:hypothetical protein